MPSIVYTYQHSERRRTSIDRFLPFALLPLSFASFHFLPTCSFTRRTCPLWSATALATSSNELMWTRLLVLLQLITGQERLRMLLFIIQTDRRTERNVRWLTTRGYGCMCRASFLTCERFRHIWKWRSVVYEVDFSFICCATSRWPVLHIILELANHLSYSPWVVILRFYLIFSNR